MPGSHPGAERNGPRMDGIFHELSRKIDPAKLLGYLNFSDGRSDPKFQKGLADAAAFLLAAGEVAPWDGISRWLGQALAELESSGSPAFRDARQAHAAFDAAFVRFPAAYRSHHADLLAHQPDADLFVPFFLARPFEAVLRPVSTWDHPTASSPVLWPAQRLRRLPPDRASKRGRIRSTSPTRRCGPVPVFLKGLVSRRESTPISSALRSNCWRRPTRCCSTNRALPPITSTNLRSTRGRTTTSTR